MRKVKILAKENLGIRSGSFLSYLDKLYVFKIFYEVGVVGADFPGKKKLKIFKKLTHPTVRLAVFKGYFRYYISQI